MNLALPALVILLGILPGVVCFHGYFAGRFDKHTAGVYGGEEIALYLILAIPIDILALILLRHFFGIEFDFDVATRMLTGVSDGVADRLVDKLKHAAHVSGATYLGVLAASYAVGSFARRFVWAFRLDVRVRILRVRHNWFYLLQGRQPDIPRKVLSYADVLTSHGGASLLYQGLVVDFEIAQDGSIESLTLIGARRGSGRGEEFKWKDIPGHRFTIMGTNIHSINMRYGTFNVDNQAGWRHHVRVCFRSFWLQEQ